MCQPDCVPSLVPTVREVRDCSSVPGDSETRLGPLSCKGPPSWVWAQEGALQSGCWGHSWVSSLAEFIRVLFLHIIPISWNNSRDRVFFSRVSWEGTAQVCLGCSIPQLSSVLWFSSRISGSGVLVSEFLKSFSGGSDAGSDWALGSLSPAQCPLWRRSPEGFLALPGRQSCGFKTMALAPGSPGLEAWLLCLWALEPLGSRSTSLTYCLFTCTVRKQVQCPMGILRIRRCHMHETEPGACSLLSEYQPWLV